MSQEKRKTSQDEIKSQDEVEIALNPERPMVDEEVEIKVKNLEPDEEITVRAVGVEGKTGESYARFSANPEGVVDLSSQAPIEGTYEGVNPMGIFQFMELKDTDVDDKPEIKRVRKEKISVECEDGDLVTREIERVFLDQDCEVSDVDHDDLVGDLYIPAGDGPHSAVIILGGSDGRRPRGPRASLLASQGYAVLGLAYFGTEDDTIPDDLDEISLEYFGKAIDWLKERDDIKSEPMGVIGTSRGSEGALLIGSRFSEVRTAIGIAPSAIKFEGLDENMRPTETSAWSEDGEALTHISFDSSIFDFLSMFWHILRAKPIEIAPKYLEAAEDADEERLNEATIPVEETDGRILLISGGDDRLWKSKELAELGVERLEDHSYEHPYKHVSFEGVGHTIGVPYTPVRGRRVAGSGRMKMMLGGGPKGYARADVESWKKTLKHLEKGLKEEEY